MNTKIYARRRSRIYFTRTTVTLTTGLLLSVTALSAAVIPVTNPSFEDTTGVTFVGCGGTCQFSTGPIPGWVNGGSTGQFQPGGPSGSPNAFFNSLPDGPTSAYSNGGTISQTVAGVTVQAGVEYELMVDLGERNDDTVFTGSADLLVGSTTIPATGVAPASGDWSTFIATFTGTAAEAGDPITIQLNSSGTQGNFDNVRLDAVPEPASIGIVGFGLALAGVAYRRRKRTVSS